MGSSQGDYTIRKRVSIAETPTLRVRLLELDVGQCVPWHYHSHITDTFFCMEGPVQVRTRRPERVHVLVPGATVAVGPGTPHYVSGVEGGPCRFMIVQGVGEYDFVPIEE